MQGSHSLFGALRRRLKDERGWALVDALASSVVVVLAFVGTTMAFNGSTASVARDAKKTQALIVAQNQINQLRGVAQGDINDLINNYNNTTTTVDYKGVTYNVERSAYYVTGLGTDQQDACEVAYASGGGTARYIYIKVNVTYAGQINTASGSSSSYLNSPASLDTYYSPEGGGVQADTGTLRVYILNRNNGVAGVTGQVHLYVAGSTSDAVPPQTPNPTTGCVLFTGLVRNSYQVKVPVSTKQDIYMTNAPGTDAVTLPVVMPDRGSLSREVRVDLPVTVTPRFYTSTGSSSNYEVRTANGGTNAFFGKWIGATDQIKAAPTTDFSYIPTGISFMPHQTTPSAGTLPNAMFPNAAGYAAWAGPCDINNPNIGVTDGSNYQVQVPTNPSDSGWLPGGSYTPTLWLSQIRTSLTLTGATGPPSPTAPNSTYNYGLSFAPSTSPATVQVRLKSDTEGSPATPRCKPSTSLVGTWQTLGSLSASGVRLSPDAEALPVGRYDVCVTFPWTATRRTTSSTNVLQTPTTLSGTAYFSTPDSDLGYRTFLDRAFTASWPSTSQTTPTLGPNGSTTDCSP